MLDLGSRRLLGYSMADHMCTELVTDALDMAAASAGATAGIIFPETAAANKWPVTTVDASPPSTWSSRWARTRVCMFTP